MSTQQPSSHGADTRPVLVVRYASLSRASDDPDQESIESQLAAQDARQIQLYGADGFVLVAEHSDDGYSGSKRNRGPGLEGAIDAAVRAAQEHGGCELWANTSARFARGTSKPNEARAIGELFYEMRRQGVTLRAVHDDEFVSNEMLVGIGSTIAAKYSQDLSESVARARLREFNNGEFQGGTPRDGYKIVRVHDEEGRIVGRKIVLDEPRADLWRRIFELARQGISDGQIARRLNAEGERTRSGRYFDRRAIGDGLDNPFYAGRLRRNVRGPGAPIVVEGKQPPLIPPAEFDALQRMRRERRAVDTPPRRAKNRAGAGRPPQNHALNGLAVCGVCGETMASVTSNYKRKDGSHRRIYQCRSGMSGAGNCGAPCVSAELIDGEIVAGLDRLLIDFESWRNRIESSHADERDRLARELDRAQRDHAAQESRHGAIQRKWADYAAAGDNAKADLVLEAVERERDALAQAQRRMEATRDALDSIPEHADHDALLDFANALQAAIRGRLDEANGSMGAVNAALRELFEAFVLRECDERRLDPTKPGYARFVPTGRRLVVVEPYLRRAIADALAQRVQAQVEGTMFAKDDPDAPPLRWLTVPPAPEPQDGGEDTLTNIPTTSTPSACRSRRR